MFKLMKNFKRIDWLFIAISLAIIIGQVFLDLKIPDFMSKITILIKTGGTTAQILEQGGYMLLCAGGSLGGAIFVGFLISNISARFSMNVRKKVYDKVQEFSMEEINGFSTASLITRTTNDITNVQMLISMGMQLIIKAPITAVWAILKILNKSWQWSLLTGGAIAILLIAVVVLMIMVFPRFKKVQKYIDDINNVTKESLTGIRVVRAFNAEEYQEQKFEEKNNTLTKTQIFNQRTMGILNPIMYLVMNSLTLGIYWLGAYIINGTDILSKATIFADMVVFSSYAMQVISAFLMLVMIFIMWPRASVSAKRINEVLEKDTKIVSGGFSGNTNLKGTIEFKNVSFKYPDAEEYMLKNISFKANMGETIAFIGSTGSGKSTLINLILRFYDCTEGQIFIDGVNIKDYDLEALYNKLGYVPQKAVLLAGSVKQNMQFGDSGKNIDEEQILTALDIAQGKSFVEKMEGGLDGRVAQGGSNLSGGQKQRLAIARAIVKDPEIYIFDDCFSALDYKTDYTVRNKLKKHTKGATNVIVAQRIGTIMNADNIVVLEKGECVGIGTHKELLKKCKVYKEIAYSQLSKEELENA
ncbi:MAG: ABC transporter ATP-binding protein [Clostridiales bacterium]|nr:ABC transporter ATP-binding protein [Clostridiales bacterium]